jgi:hypothetical protein
VNQFQVAVVADRVHLHQRLDQLQGARRHRGKAGWIEGIRNRAPGQILADSATAGALWGQLCSNAVFSPVSRPDFVFYSQCLPFPCSP